MTMRDLPVRIIGGPAQAVAAADGARRVFARFERSLYARDEAGQIACVGGDGIGSGPLNILLDVEVFDTAPFSDGDHLEFDLSQAKLWHPPECPPADSAGLRRGQATLTAAFRHVAPRGLAAERRDDLVSVRASTGLAALRTWVAAPSTPVPDAVTALLGLGPGLTPAGDDALAGALIALCAFGQRATAEQLASALLPLARRRTNAISCAHLKAAAAGEGTAALHDTLVAAIGADERGTIDGVRRLDRIGHSSGWDALAGTLAIFPAD